MTRDMALRHILRERSFKASRRRPASLEKIVRYLSQPLPPPYYAHPHSKKSVEFSDIELLNWRFIISAIGPQVQLAIRGASGSIDSMTPSLSPLLGFVVMIVPVLGFYRCVCV